jgi:hypothetical protein
MADVTQPLLNNVSPAAAGTFYGTPFNTLNFRDFALRLSMPTTTGTGSDTLDIVIESSSEQTFANAYKIMRVKLVDADNTLANAFTQVVGGTTLPGSTSTATTLRQYWNIKDVNVAQYLRVRYIVAGTATSFTGIQVDLLANRKV